VGKVIDALDKERIQIAQKLNIDTKPFCEIFYQFGFTTTKGLKGGNAYHALQNSPPNRWTTGPETGLDHRYIHEDVGHGLVPLAEMAKQLGVETPIMDAFITLASTVNEVDYRIDGLNLERLGLFNIPPKDLNRYLWEGAL
jgi:opine dehydrogenase